MRLLDASNNGVADGRAGDVRDLAGVGARGGFLHAGILGLMDGAREEVGCGEEFVFDHDPFIVGQVHVLDGVWGIGGGGGFGAWGSGGAGAFRGGRAGGGGSGGFGRASVGVQPWEGSRHCSGEEAGFFCTANGESADMVLVVQGRACRW